MRSAGQFLVCEREKENGVVLRGHLWLKGFIHIKQTIPASWKYPKTFMFSSGRLILKRYYKNSFSQTFKHSALQF
jgi:hypothetical protein